ncbi:hypothetical protein F4776DRAFT_651337 [Hypoxylon sp. NC0597]|nr:hypothetical protein F4776DRAFT_651337 [Hypoxylon sp. NC0597]
MVVENMKSHDKLKGRALLYHQLKKERSGTIWAEPCGTCKLMYRLDCTHLTASQCAKLKPARNTVGAEAKGTEKVIQVYECGHAFHNNRRVKSRSGGAEKYQKGLCIECWCVLVWDGVVRIGKVNGARRPPKNNSVKSRKRRKTPKAVIKNWVRRGPVVGSVELSGKHTKLF